VQIAIADDNSCSLAQAPMQTRLLNTPNSDAAQAVAACEQALTDYNALREQDDALREWFRRRGLPLITARYWLAPNPNDDVLALDDSLATLLAFE